MHTSLAAGTIHNKVPADFKTALLNDQKTARHAWQDITPLARNEFLCWILEAKQTETRARRIQVALDKLNKGERRPCCWAGCIHRERNGK